MHRVVNPFARRRPEPVIGLINVVFLMLVFFLIAGSVAPPLDREIRLVRLDEAGAPPPPDVLALTADGRLRAGGAETTVADFLAGLPEAPPVRLMPDREAPAARLVEVARALRAGGASRVIVVTERGLP
jgi:biopolymer transport protein ExbD